MKYRNIRVRATGQWVDVVFGADGKFAVPADSHLRTVAAALGLTPRDLELVEATTDQRIGTLVPQPPGPSPDPDVPGYRGAMLEKLGLRKANALLRDYPTYMHALDVGNFPVAKGIIDMALADGAILQADYDTILATMREFHVSEALS